MLCILLGIDIYAFSLVGTKTGPSVDEDAAMELLAITRIEIARFFKSRGDSAVMISTPTVAKYLLNIFASPVINLDGSVAGHSITDATTSILELSVMKVLQRLGNRKDERTAGYLSYVKTIVDIIISFAKSNEKIGYILSHAVLAPAVCWLDVRMRQADQDVSLKNMDAEVRSSILGLVSIVTERVLALDMIFNVLDTRHLRSQFDILECLLVFYRLSGDKRVYDFVQELLAVIVKASTSEEGEQTEIVLLAGRLFSIFASHVVENRQEILDADFLCLFEAGRLLLERMCALGKTTITL
ncbi:hypothetical protein BC829DRAFT_186610 [Chytridium lagenaria]|nr:hypothetical protein BC829DRAFT_186610 [Chytridium lagenaria]